jgi:hypothetical protein
MPARTQTNILPNHWTADVEPFLMANPIILPSTVGFGQ